VTVLWLREPETMDLRGRSVNIRPQNASSALLRLGTKRRRKREREQIDLRIHVDVVTREIERDEELEEEGEAGVRRREEAEEARGHASVGG
jgi:hypothetical protein